MLIVLLYQMLKNVTFKDIKMRLTRFVSGC